MTSRAYSTEGSWKCQLVYQIRLDWCSSKQFQTIILCLGTTWKLLRSLIFDDERGVRAIDQPLVQ